MSLRNKQEWVKSNKITVSVEANSDTGIWEVHVWQIHRSGKVEELKQTISVKNHKYGKQCVYILVCPWDYETGKRIPMTLQRIVYMYFKGDIPEGYDIDHIDNDSLNNLPSNLQALTRKDNLAKRTLSQKEIAINYRKIEKNSRWLLYNILRDKRGNVTEWTCEPASGKAVGTTNNKKN